MAEAKSAKKTKFTAETVRKMKQDERLEALVEKQSELHDAKRSLSARELTNPRKITQLKKEIAIIKTVNNEANEESN